MHLEGLQDWLKTTMRRDCLTSLSRRQTITETVIPVWVEVKPVVDVSSEAWSVIEFLNFPSRKTNWNLGASKPGCVIPNVTFSLQSI